MDEETLRLSPALHRKVSATVPAAAGCLCVSAEMSDLKVATCAESQSMLSGSNDKLLSIFLFRR